MNKIKEGNLDNSYTSSFSAVTTASENEISTQNARKPFQANIEYPQLVKPRSFSSRPTGRMCPRTLERPIKKRKKTFSTNKKICAGKLMPNITRTSCPPVKEIKEEYQFEPNLHKKGETPISIDKVEESLFNDSKKPIESPTQMGNPHKPISSSSYESIQEEGENTEEVQTAHVEPIVDRVEEKIQSPYRTVKNCFDDQTLVEPIEEDADENNEA